MINFKLIFICMIQLTLLSQMISVAGVNTQSLVKMSIKKSEVMFPYNINDNLFAVYSEELHDIKSNTETSPYWLDSSETAHVARQRNYDILNEFKKVIQPEESEIRSSSDLQELAQSVLTSLVDHPVAGRPALEKYDPTGEVGFCFGRAAYVHLELLQRGFDPNRIGKIFALGNFNYKGQHWDFHVATFIWDNKSILVIDDTVEKIMTINEWMDTVEKFDIYPEASTMMIYMTDPSKFHPALGFYSEKNFNLPQYNKYFLDLKKSFKSLNFFDKKTSYELD